MATKPWVMACMLLLAALSLASRRNHPPKAKISYPFQLVVTKGNTENYTVLLDGSQTIHADVYEWREVEKPSNAKKSKFTAKFESVTNVTIDNEEGEHRFRLHAKRIGHGKGEAFSSVYVEKPASVGMYLFASNVVKKLLIMQYQYISLSQHHLRADNFHPRVSKYFRELASDRGQMLQDVTKHVLEKQATEDLINSCPTDYVDIMMSHGFSGELNYDVTVNEFMTSSFDIAKRMENELAGELALVSHHAERNKDHELSEFVGADLIPRVTKIINSHTNHLETTLRPADSKPTKERHLVEFLFDKYISW